MRVLFIGGTGIISSACSALAVASGMELYLLCRGQSRTRPPPHAAHVLTCDIDDADAVRRTLPDLRFDVVVNWIVYAPNQIERDIALFQGRTRQYVFISSASVYQKPPGRLPITESTPLCNPYWEYSRNKIACEERLLRAYRETGFPITIVRPSHTYDRTLLPMEGGWTIVDRMRRERPVIVHGDGTSLWTLTHHRDFAKAFVPLLGNDGAIGDSFHITSEELLTWNRIFELVAHAAGAPEPRLVHVPSDVIATYDPNWGASLLGDKTHSLMFDNAKIKRMVPGFSADIAFSRGVREIISWYEEDPARQIVDPSFCRLLDDIIQRQGSQAI